MFDHEIGPRIPSGVYYSHQWRQYYTVLAIASFVNYREGKFEPCGWGISVKWDDGQITNHATAWDKRDKVICQPA